MTATEILRRLLDERGVEWSPSAWDRSTETYWKTSDGNGCLAAQGETKLRLSFADYLTPEQAIDATLGRGTCQDVCAGISEFTCSSCGFNCDLTSWISLFDGDEGRHRHHHHGTPNYCPNCGRKVKEG